MTTRGKAIVTARAVGKRDIAVTGPGVFDAITEKKIPHMRPRATDRKVSVWLIPADRAEELFTYLERKTGRRVEVTL